MNKIISKEDFIKVWKDSSKESILNQYYYDYTTLEETIWKAIELIDEPICYATDKMETPKIFIRRLKEVKDILQGEDK